VVELALSEIIALRVDQAGGERHIAVPRLPGLLPHDAGDGRPALT
jgi:hypothetical protein